MLTRLLLASALLAEGLTMISGSASAARHHGVGLTVAPLNGAACGWRQVRVGTRFEWRRVCT